MLVSQCRLMSPCPSVREKTVTVSLVRVTLSHIGCLSDGRKAAVLRRCHIRENVSHCRCTIAPRLSHTRRVLSIAAGRSFHSLSVGFFVSDEKRAIYIQNITARSQQAQSLVRPLPAHDHSPEETLSAVTLDFRKLQTRRPSPSLFSATTL